MLIGVRIDDKPGTGTTRRESRADQGTLHARRRRTATIVIRRKSR